MFSAPIALASMAFGTYIGSVFHSMSPKIFAIGILFLISSVTFLNRESGYRFQNGATMLKVLPIGFLLFGLIMWDKQGAISFLPQANDVSRLFNSTFAVASVWHLPLARWFWRVPAY